jgi:large subunit ribosomal protein L29e
LSLVFFLTRSFIALFFFGTDGGTAGD